MVVKDDCFTVYAWASKRWPVSPQISRSCDQPPCRRWAMPLPDTTTPWRSEPVTVAFGYGYVASKLGDVPPACYLSLSENWVCSPLNSPNLRPRFSFQKPDGILRCVSGLTLSCIKTHSFFLSSIFVEEFWRPIHLSCADCREEWRMAIKHKDVGHLKWTMVL